MISVVDPYFSYHILLWYVVDCITDGTVVLGCLPNKVEAGDIPLSSGVLLRESNAKYATWLLSFVFLRVRFTVCMCLSTSPLEFGYSGDDVRCKKSHVVANSLNSWLVNCGPLSE